MQDGYSRYTLEDLYDIARRTQNTLFSREYKQVMKEIEKREHTILPPAPHPPGTLWRWVKWIAIAVFLVVVIENIAPFYFRSKRPAWEAFTATQTFAKKMNAGDMAKLRGHTRQWVVVEGPCDGGCQGGIVSGTDVRELIPEWRLKNSDTNAVAWLVRMQPEVIRRRNDLWGEDELVIHAKPLKVGTVYFAVVPTMLVRPRLQWIYTNLTN